MYPTGVGTRTTCVLWPSRFSMTSNVDLLYFSGFTLALWNHRLLSTTSTGIARMLFTNLDGHLWPTSQFWLQSFIKSFNFHIMLCSERMSRLLVPFADQHVEIPSMSAGNIALTVGLKQVEHHSPYVLLYLNKKVISVFCLLWRLSQGTPSFHQRLQQQQQLAAPTVMAGQGRSVASMSAWSFQE